MVKSHSYSDNHVIEFTPVNYRLKGHEGGLVAEWLATWTAHPKIQGLKPGRAEEILIRCVSVFHLQNQTCWERNS